MGHILLRDGSSVWTEKLSGSIGINQILGDVGCDLYTDSYRAALINVLGFVALEAADTEKTDILTRLHGFSNSSIPRMRDEARVALKRVSLNFAHLEVQ